VYKFWYEILSGSLQVEGLSVSGNTILETGAVCVECIECGAGEVIREASFKYATNSRIV
jgi:hypothetical protein